MIRILTILMFIFFTGCNSGSGKKDKKVVIAAIATTDSLRDEKNWNSTDYIMSIASFKTMKDADQATFVKYIRTTGAAQFEKITDYGQYDSLYTGKNLEQRFIINTSLSDALRTLLKLCSDPGKEDGKLILGHEIIRSFMASMASFKTSISLVNEKFPDLEKLNEVQRGGLQKMKLGLFEMIHGSLMTIHADHAFYSKDDIVTFSRFISSYIKDVWSFLDETQQERVDEEIKKLKNSDTYQEVKLAFSE